MKAEELLTGIVTGTIDYYMLKNNSSLSVGKDNTYIVNGEVYEIILWKDDATGVYYLHHCKREEKFKEGLFDTKVSDFK